MLIKKLYILALLGWAPQEALASGNRFVLICGNPAVACPGNRLPDGSRILRRLDEINAVVFESDVRSAAALSSALLPGDIVSRDEERSFLDDREAKPARMDGGLSGRVAGAREGDAKWGVSRVNAPGVWPRFDGTGAVVAIVDTGVDMAHPDLKDNVIGGYNFIDPGASAQDDNGHGTHVAGIVAALRNGKDVVGVAPNAKLLAVKVLDSAGRGTISDMAAGIIWAVDHGANIINVSMGDYSPSEVSKAAVDYAASKLVLVVAAAGNSGEEHVTYPAAYDSVLAVSAINKQDTMTGFSNYGHEVDFVAPGFDIESLALGGGTASSGGTSTAAPHVSGLAALAYSAGAKDAASMRRSLEGAAVHLGAIMPEYQGAGLIDAGRIFYP